MMDFLFVSCQVLFLMGCLYGAYLSMAYRGTLKSSQGRKYRGVELKPEAVELSRLPQYMGYYV